MQNKLIVYTDGGARGNPGPAAIGVVITDSKGLVLLETGETIGIATNNVAEYKAVLKALSWILENKDMQQRYREIVVYMDSELVCRQLNRQYKVKNELLLEIFYQIRRCESEFSIPISYIHISRENNKLSDKLVNRALDNIE